MSSVSPEEQDDAESHVTSTSPPPLSSSTALPSSSPRAESYSSVTATNDAVAHQQSVLRHLEAEAARIRRNIARLTSTTLSTVVLPTDLEEAVPSLNVELQASKDNEIIKDMSGTINLEDASVLLE
jgi:hypothetical protein